jgi:transmembrane sensor
MNDNPINQAAFDWLARVDAGLTAAETAEFEAWLAADARHYGAYIRAQAVFGQARRIKAFAHSPDPDDWAHYIQAGNDDPPREAEAGDSVDAPARRVSRRAFFGVAGGVAAVGLAAAFFATGRPAQALTFQTGLGERRDVLLADGSRVALNTDSELRVLFDKTLRIVELIRGEALYNVVHDGKRPFIVDAAGFKVRADEASFAIQQLRGFRPQLLVKEGTVDVTPNNSTSLKVEANTKITFLIGSKLSGVMLSPEEMDRELMWREGKIAFEDTPLYSAIATFDRYGPVHIDVQDPYLLNRTVSGVFSSDDPMGFAKVVAELFDLNAIPEGKGIALRRKG